MDASTPQHFVCMNCDGPLADTRRSDSLYCSQRCKQLAAFVRTARRALARGVFDGSVFRALKVQRMTLLGWGYPDMRKIPKAVKYDVIIRGGGRCQICGNLADELDHCNDPTKELYSAENIRLLCRKCFFRKVMTELPDGVEAERIELAAHLRQRIYARQPLKPCDNARSWKNDWEPICKETSLQRRRRKVSLL